jgi:hypothetical protein
MTSAETVVADGGGLRYNEGKPPMELIPPEALWSLAEVLALGAKKYARRNWERGMSWSTVYACLFRHLLKWFQGEDKDAESGLSHLDHVLWNAMALVVYERRRIGTDDRPVVQKSAQVPDVLPDRTAESPYLAINEARRLAELENSRSLDKGFPY